MKKKNGFTLIELLAVIVVLAVIMLIAIPSVSKMTSNAKRAAFQDETKQIYKIAKEQYIASETDKLFETGSLNVKNGDKLKYSLLFDDDGGLICYEINNDDYIYRFRDDGENPIKTIDEVGAIENIEDWDKNVISECRYSDEMDTTEKSTILANGDWWKFSPAEMTKDQVTTIIIENSSDAIPNGAVKYNVATGAASGIGGITVYIESGEPIVHIVNNTNRSYKNAFLVSPDASNMFSGFTNLRKIQGLKLLDMSQVTKIDNMFSGCPSLTQLVGIEYWNTESLESAQNAFNGVKLTNIDLSTWNTPKLKNTSNMFKDTKAKQINLSGWDVSKVTNYSNMFDGTAADTIILAGWATQSTATYTGMFNNASDLKTIITTKDFRVSNNSVTMFQGDNKIEGENGTHFIDATSKYAKLDTASVKGYFTEISENGLITAKLYNSGSVSNDNTNLTESGSTAADWNYYAGVRLLEVSLTYMNTSKENTLDITVPTGMYIKNNSWTTGDSKIESVEFVKNTSQGTGSYVNENTGTLKYKFKPGTSAVKVQCLVMFDEAIWDKHRYKEDDVNNGIYLTKDDAITVNFNNGQNIKKIAHIRSANSVGGGTGAGYSLYTYKTNSNVYLEESKVLLSATSLLSTDQSQVKSFYKKVEFETYATSTNSSGNTIYADLEVSSIPSYLNNGSGSISGGKYKGTWTDAYATNNFGFPRLKYKVSASKGFIAGKTLTVTVNVTLTSYSGQVYTKTSTQQFTIKGTNPDISDLVVSGGGHTSPYNTYYESSGLMDLLGSTAVENRGYGAFNNVTLKYEFDTGRETNGRTTLRVYGINLPSEAGQTFTVRATMINDAGDTAIVEKEKTCGTTTSGAFVSAEDFKPGYYFKSIEYTLPKISGTSGNSTNYLYCSQCSQSITGGGVYVGTIANTGTNASTRLTVTAEGYSAKTVNVTTAGTTSFNYSGCINQIKTADNKVEYKAGDNIELDVQLKAVEYPYTHTQAFSEPEVYIILPEGVKIEHVVISNSVTSNTSDATPVITKVKTAEVKGQVNNVYKISFKSKIWFGYVMPTATYAGSLNPTKWVRISLSTNPGMDYSSMNLRDTVYFKDKNGQISIGGSYGKNTTTDKYDVNNNGITGEYFGVIDKTDQEIIIREVTE